MMSTDKITAKQLSDRLTITQRRALRLIVEAGGGAIMRNGTVLCAGQDGSSSDYGQPLHSATWLRLCGMELIKGSGGRLVPTLLGHLVARETPQETP